MPGVLQIDKEKKGMTEKRWPGLTLPVRLPFDSVDYILLCFIDCNSPITLASYISLFRTYF